MGSVVVVFKVMEIKSDHNYWSLLPCPDSSWQPGGEKLYNPILILFNHPDTSGFPCHVNSDTLGSGDAC